MAICRDLKMWPSPNASFAAENSHASESRVRPRHGQAARVRKVRGAHRARAWLSEAFGNGGEDGALPAGRVTCQRHAASPARCAEPPNLTFAGGK